MKKLLKLAAVLVVLSLAFTACPRDPEDEDAVVTGISLRVATSATGTPGAAKPAHLNPGHERWFTAVVTGEGDFNETYTMTVDIKLNGVSDPNLIVVEDVGGGKKVTIKSAEAAAAIAAGTVVLSIEAKSVGLDADSNEKVANWEIDINATPITVPVADFSNAQWKLLNLKQGPLTAGTTATMPAAGADKRYTIFNNEPLAGMDGNPADNYKYIRDSTIMYLDVPIVADLGDFKMYGIEARVRTTRLRDTAPPGAAHVGTVVFGIMTNPEDIGVLEYEPAGGTPGPTSPGLGTNSRITNASRDKAPDIAGVRAPQNGGVWRGHMTRNHGAEGADATPAYGGVNLHSATTISGNNYALADSTIPDNDLQVALRGGQAVSYAANIGLADNSANKVEGFVNQEYIVRFMRTQMAEFAAFIFNTDGKFLHAARLVWSNAGAETLVTDTPHYFAFIVSGAEVEISDIRVFYDVPIYTATNNSPVFGAMNDDIVPVWVDSAVANATPIKDTFATRLYGTARNTLGADGTGFDYAISTTDDWTNFTIACQVLPITMSQLVTWEIVGDAIVSLSGTGASRTVSRVGTGSGEATIRVTSTGSTTVNNRPVGEFKIKIAEPTTNIQSVTITAPAENFAMNAVGQTVTLTASIYPGTSPQGVTWAVWANEDGTGATDLVTIGGANNNVLTVASLPVADTTVYVIATSIQDTSKSSDARAIVIRAPGSGPEIAYEWKAADVVDTITLDSGTAIQVGDVYWQRGAGTITVTNTGAACPTASRFMIGTGNITSITATTSTVHSAGELDLSRKAKVFITYEDLSGNLLQVYLNNNTTGQANSVLGGNSRIFNGGTGGSNTIIPANGVLELTIDPADFANHVSLATAFLQIRIGDGSNATTINITGVRIEYD